MNTLTANEAQTHFGELLLNAQRAPIQISKNGKPVAVVISADEYESIEALKLRLLQVRATQALTDIASDKLVMAKLSLIRLMRDVTTDASNVSVNTGYPVRPDRDSLIYSHTMGIGAV